MIGLSAVLWIAVLSKGTHRKWCGKHRKKHFFHIFFYHLHSRLKSDKFDIEDWFIHQSCNPLTIGLQFIACKSYIKIWSLQWLSEMLVLRWRRCEKSATSIKVANRKYKWDPKRWAYFFAESLFTMRNFDYFMPAVPWLRLISAMFNKASAWETPINALTSHTSFEQKSLARDDAGDCSFKSPMRSRDTH